MCKINWFDLAVLEKFGTVVLSLLVMVDNCVGVANKLFHIHQQNS